MSSRDVPVHLMRRDRVWSPRCVAAPSSAPTPAVAGTADTIRQEQADALLASRLERGGGMPVPMALVPSVLGGMICSYSFMSMACKPNLHEAWKPS